jgi:hypothetical protein
MKRMIGESDSSPSPFASHLQTLLIQLKKKPQQFAVIEPISAVYNFARQTEVAETPVFIGSLIRERAEEPE